MAFSRILSTITSWSTERKLSVVFVIVALTFAIGNSVIESEWSRFRAAKKMDNIYGWMTFLEHAKDIEYIAYAKERLASQQERILWNRIAQTQTPELLQTYVSEHPLGEHASAAQKQLNELADQAVLELPDLPSEEDLDRFIVRWRNTEAAEQIEGRRQKYWDSIDWVREENTKLAFARFIKRNPSSPHVQDCKKRMIDIEVDQAAADPSGFGSLPPMDRVGGGAGSRTEIKIKNDTGFVLDVLYSGPSSERVVVGIGDFVRTSLSNGQYRILASVRSLRVDKYFGKESLDGGSFEVTYYVTSH